MNNIPADQRATARDLCERARNGMLSLEELHSRWPRQGVGGEMWLQEVFDDVEDAVEHLPGSFVTGKVDYKTWHRSYEFLVLYLDCMLLRNNDEATISRWRSEILQGELQSIRHVEEAVHRCAGRM